MAHLKIRKQPSSSISIQFWQLWHICVSVKLIFFYTCIDISVRRCLSFYWGRDDHYPWCIGAWVLQSPHTRHETSSVLSPTTDIWWQSLETRSNFSLEDLPPWYWHLVVATEKCTVGKQVASCWNAVLFYT